MAMTLAPLGSRSDDQGDGLAEEGNHARRERLFEKVVTPSDVGKLNRLVVPKHFAEKHLPLLGAARAGTVLCFHDARGHASWRFRYSYWGSSQSYVMTKGWSRYVRDKRLAAGDTVSFCRDGARLFIDCRRRRKRPAIITPPAVPPATLLPLQDCSLSKVQQHLSAPPPVVVIVNEEAQRGQRTLRLFGVDLEPRAEPLLLDLQL